MSEDFKVGSLLLEIYRPKFEEYFQDHPDKDKILEGIFAGEYTNDEIDTFFGEAARYTYDKIISAIPSPVAKDIISIERYDYGTTHDSYPDYGPAQEMGS